VIGTVSDQDARRGRGSAAARVLPLLLLLALLPALQCRRAEGVPRDPLDREAEDAFVGYLKIDTTNPPGNETAGAVYIRDLLVNAGIEAKLVGKDPRRQGVWARLASNDPGKEKGLLLLSHIDVVPADAAAWSHPPFGGAREGGYIWGRGALDIKSLTIAHAMALIDLKRRGATLRRDVALLAVPDEELGGANGAKALLESNPELFEGLGFLVNEGGSNETAVDRVIAWGIEVQQKVPLWLRITAEGQGGHGAVPPPDGGAPMKLMRALTAITAIPRPYRLESSVAAAAATAVAVRKDGRGAKMRLLSEPLDMDRIAHELPYGYRVLLQDTIAVTRISAGTAVNVIPSRASADVDIRLLPDEEPDAMLAKIREAAGDQVTVEVLLASKPVPPSPAEGELFESLARTMRSAAPGSAVVPVVGAGTTDSRWFRARGFVAYGVSPFKVNYYDADSVHGVDERIRARFFSEGVRLTRAMVRDFCAEK
jgi:acetylornithine deacetylase/succinyl-diaminopimelate desuccinylase-like protein